MPGDRRQIFISYRRGDEPGYTQSLYLMLEQTFGAGAIFKDIEGGFQPGDDFPDELRRRVAEADILLAVIGPGWLKAVDEQGRRRLDDPADWVRIEIVSALEATKRVVPVLVNAAPFLRAEDLPEPLQPLTRKQVVRLTNERFAPECRGMIERLKTALAEAEAERKDAVLRAEAEARRRAEEEAAAKRKEEQARAAQAERARSAETGAAMAPEQIERLEELLNWQAIQPRRDISEHRDHLARYPDGPMSRNVRIALDGLVWAATEQDDATSLQAYVGEFPDGEQTTVAQSRLDELARAAADRRAADNRARQEDVVWAQVSTSDQKEDIEAFLSAYPDGKHADAARKRLRELRGGTRRWLLRGGIAAAAAGGGLIWQLQPGEALWKLLLGPHLRTFTGHSGSVLSVAFAPDGRTVISGTGDRTLRLWDVETGDSLRTFTGHSDWVRSVAFAPDGRTVISGSADNTLRLWDVETGDSLRTFTGHSDWVRSVAFARTGAP